METFGATVHASPTEPDERPGARCWPNRLTRRVARHPISEAVEVRRLRWHVQVSLGSVLNHVLLHQNRHRAGSACAKWSWRVNIPMSSIAAWRREQLFGDCFPVSLEQAPKHNGKDTRFIAVEPTAAPSITKMRICLRLWRPVHMTPLGQDVHAGAHLRCQPASTRVDCAIMGWLPTVAALHGTLCRSGRRPSEPDDSRRRCSSQRLRHRPCARIGARDSSSD